MTDFGSSRPEAIAFADRTIEVLKGVLAADATITLRGDSGFWSKKMAAWLLDHEIPFIFALPLRAGVKILLKNTRWRGLEGDSDIQVTEIAGDRLGMDSRLRVIGIRRRVRDEKAPPQGKTIDGCSMWRYQALVTCMPGTPEDLWRFYNDRSDCERIFKVARGALGMGWLISHCLRANEVAFLLRLLGYNVGVQPTQHRPRLRAQVPESVAGTWVATAGSHCSRMACGVSADGRSSSRPRISTR